VKLFQDENARRSVRWAAKPSGCGDTSEKRQPEGIAILV
jgi:hypothetical protein